MNFLSNLLSSQALETYKQTEYPFNLSIVHTALKQKLQEDPDYEVFVPLIYCQCAVYLEDKNTAALLKPYKYFISNKGVVISLRDNEIKSVTIGLSAGGYLRFSFPYQRRSWYSVVLHRALASSFIPVKQDLDAIHPKDLQVNHIDGIKINCPLDNLEWCTSQENIQHAFDTGLNEIKTGLDHHATKPVKGTVLEGEFKGYEFILIGRKEYGKFGFNQSNVNTCCTGETTRYKGCSFAYATEEEINILPRGVGEDILLSIPKTVWPVKSEILVTNIASGEQIVVTRGKIELREMGFNITHVSSVINGKRRHHKGHVFERI